MVADATIRDRGEDQGDRGRGRRRRGMSRYYLDGRRQRAGPRRRGHCRRRSAISTMSPLDPAGGTPKLKKMRVHSVRARRSPIAPTSSSWSTPQAQLQLVAADRRHGARADRPTWCCARCAAGDHRASATPSMPRARCPAKARPRSSSRPPRHPISLGIQRKRTGADLDGLAERNRRRRAAAAGARHVALVPSRLRPAARLPADTPTGRRARRCRRGARGLCAGEARPGHACRISGGAGPG